MLVRSAIPADVRVIAEIHVASSRMGYRGLLPDAHLDELSVTQREQHWAKQLAGQEWHTLVAEVAGKIQGWVSYSPARDADAADAVEVMGFYVDPEFYGGGVGRVLWSALMEELAAKGHKRLVVWVLKDNVRARRFYEAAGGQFDQNSEKGFTCRDVVLPQVRYWYAVPGTRD